MRMKLFTTISIVFFAVAAGFAQRPGDPPGRPGAGAPPRDGQMRPGDDIHPPHDDWMKRLDTNQDGKLDASELKASMDTSFAAWDKNGNGVIEPGEMPRPPRGPQPPNGQGNGLGNGQGSRPQGPPMAPQGLPMGQGLKPDGTSWQGARPQGPPQMGPEGGKMLPPFFFADRNPEGAATSRADFERIVKSVFAEMDKNGDGVIARGESLPPRREGDAPGQPEGPPPPNARFIGNELRFGDKLVAGQPFSAETVIEDTRRLFDGSIVTKQNRGAIYRDGAGRTRREQPLEMVGGINISGANNKRVTLIFINDFPGKAQYSLDQDNKIARKSPLWSDNWPFPQVDGPRETKAESLGNKTIEGVAVEGTKTTFEIPAGQLGNAKPILVVDEKWFSLELQVLVMSRHLDPVNGEHIFKLVNIKRSEPVADLFAVPAGFRIENRPGIRPE